MRRKNKSGNPLGMAVGVVFVAVLLLAGVIASQISTRSSGQAGENPPPAAVQQAYHSSFE